MVGSIAGNVLDALWAGDVHLSKEVFSEKVLSDLKGLTVPKDVFTQAVSSKPFWNICYIGSANLQKGDTVSCGCYAQEARINKHKDLTGQRFGRLVAREYISGAVRSSAEFILLSFTRSLP